MRLPPETVTSPTLPSFTVHRVHTGSENCNTQMKRFQSTVLLYMWLMQEVHTNALYHNHVAVVSRVLVVVSLVLVVVVVVVVAARDCATLTSSSGMFFSINCIHIDSPFNLCGVACSPIVAAHLKLIWLAVWTYELQRSVFQTCPHANVSRLSCVMTLPLLQFLPCVDV